MADRNPLGFLQNDNNGQQLCCNDMVDESSNYIDLTPASWITDKNTYGTEIGSENDIENLEEYNSNMMLDVVDDNTSILSSPSYLELSRTVYEAAQNLDIVEDEADEHIQSCKDYELQNIHSNLVKKMGNTLGFTCYSLKFANKDCRNSYLPRKDAYDDDEGIKNRKKRKNYHNSKLHNKIDNCPKNRSKSLINKKYNSSSDSTSISTSSSSSSESDTSDTESSQKDKHYSDNSSIADFSVDDDELKTFANNRISQIRKSMLNTSGGYDSDTGSIDLDDLGKRAQDLLNTADTKGRSLSMHNIYQAAKRS